jgi:hypothetical protein
MYDLIQLLYLDLINMSIYMSRIGRWDGMVHNLFRVECLFINLFSLIWKEKRFSPMIVSGR